jgi:hypothetical protein
MWIVAAVSMMSAAGLMVVGSALLRRHPAVAAV